MTLGGLLAGGWALQIGAEWQSVMTGDAINRGRYFSGMHSCQYCTIHSSLSDGCVLHALQTTSQRSWQRSSCGVR